MKQWIIDGNKVVIEKEEIDQKVDECEFDMYEVYALDIVVSTGDGKVYIIYILYIINSHVKLDQEQPYLREQLIKNTI